MLLPRRQCTRRTQPSERRVSTIPSGRNYTVTATGWTSSIITILTRRRSCLVQGLTTTVTWLGELRSRLSRDPRSSSLCHRPKTDSSHQQSSNTTPARVLTPLQPQSTSTSSPNTSTSREPSLDWTRRVFSRADGGARNSRQPQVQGRTPGFQTSEPLSRDQ